MIINLCFYSELYKAEETSRERRMNKEEITIKGFEGNLDRPKNR